MEDIEGQRATREARARVVTVVSPAREPSVLRYLTTQDYQFQHTEEGPSTAPRRRSAAAPTATVRLASATRDRRLARGALVTLALLVGANAVYGGVGLMVDGLGMPAAWLNRTPFDSWLLPGVLLLVVVAVPMTTAAVAELARARWAYAAGLAAGVLQVGWIVGQWIVLQRFFVLQPVLLGCGAVVAALAWWVHRR